MHLLVRNKVRDFDAWLKLFVTEDSPAAEFGLKLENLWRDADDPNTAWFVFSAESRKRADAFMARPESAELGKLSGVLDGEVHYLESVTD